MSVLSPSSIKPKFFADLTQVGIVVKDLRTSVKNYWNLFGIGPWSIYTYEPPFLTDMFVRDEESSFSMKVAFAWCGHMMLELIEPLEGESIYKEFLAVREGAHHIASYSVSEASKTISELRKMGMKTLQSGRFTKDNFSVLFTYMDTEKELGTIIELLDARGTRPEPLERYPPV
jgi:methylmalonyl-CoA/ethylmalonyl-CoA epimerase